MGALAVDIDGDGYKGPYFYDAVNDTHEGDAFPLDATQWNDKDGDGYGGSQTSVQITQILVLTFGAISQ